MKLRFQLVRHLSGPQPRACQLPEHYPLDVASDREACLNCGQPLRRVRTSTHYPLGLMLGRPRVRLIHKPCSGCHQADSLETYYQDVPPGGNYAYDLIVEVGLARLRDHRQDAEIRRDLQQRWGWSPPASSIGLLAQAFLDGLAAIHRAHLPALRERLTEDGGYARHVDGTCEAGTEVIFAAFAGPRGRTLAAARMTTENTAEISKLLRRCEEWFGTWCDRLRQRHGRERDEDKRADQKTVLSYLDKYQKQLVGHVIQLPGREKPFVAARTNNLAEHRFGSLKQGARRKVGAKKLTRYLQAMRAEELLLANLADPEYVELVCPGGLDNLPAAIAKHWHLAQAIRAERQEPTTDHPMPTTKSQIRNPGLLEGIKQTISKIVETISRRSHAA